MPRYYEYGPLVMDGWKSVATLKGKRLSLTENEYDALYLLAKQQGKPLVFEQLYELRWKPEDGLDKRELARWGMDNIVKQIKIAGKGAICVEHTPDRGYSLVLFEIDPVKQKTKNTKWKTVSISIAACVAVMFFTIMIIPLLNTPNIQGDGFLTFEDARIPLAAADLFTDQGIIFPEIYSLIITTDTLCNPDGNECNFIFELLLDGESLYQSGMVEPGARTEAVTLTDPPPKGEYNATLTIRAYAPDSLEIIDEKALEIKLIFDG